MNADYIMKMLTETTEKAYITELFKEHGDPRYLDNGDPKPIDVTYFYHECLYRFFEAFKLYGGVKLDFYKLSLEELKCLWCVEGADDDSIAELFDVPIKAVKSKRVDWENEKQLEMQDPYKILYDENGELRKDWAKRLQFANYRY